MSAKVMGAVWELDLPHNQQSVLLAYADHGDDDGFNARPGIEYVAWKTGYSERQVQRIVRALEEDGLLVEVEAAAGRRATCYRVVTSAGRKKPPYVPRHLRGVETTERRAERGDKMSGRQDVGATSATGSTGHPDVTRTIKEPERLGPNGPSQNLSFSPPEEKDGAGDLNAEFADWLADHQQVTGREPPRPGTDIRRKVRAMFVARRTQSKLTLDELKLATRGAYNDEFRRANGHYSVESVLRPTKITGLVEKGRAAAKKPKRDRSRYNRGRESRRAAT